MKTACPNCQTVFRVTSEQLRARAGKVRCGRCQNVFNALDSLLDDSEPVSSPASEANREAVTTLAVGAALPRDEEALAAEIAPIANFPAGAPAGSSPSVGSPATSPEWTAAAADAESAAVGGLAPPESPADVPAYGSWLARVSGSPAVPVRRVLTKSLALAALLLALVLAGQLVFHFRTAIAIATPGLRPALAALSEALGSEIPLPRHAEMISIEASDLQNEPGRGRLLALQATLRNAATYAQAYPALELALTDTSDKVIVRRVLLPVEYLPAVVVDNGAFAPNADVEVRLWLEAKDIQAAGYRLYVFYP
ncbi:MAG: zinc-ribbon domain-containing protein [Candidatus Accumulibacter phosphatis]|nr:zinc-ribbon domain-containing protein [Candidatus Accumulibacter phosphatis]